MKIIKKEDKQYPKKLLQIKNAPEQLYVEGNEKLLNNDCIAIVGSRKCTKYGIKYTKEFASEISQKGITIISGLADGIDTIAHDTAKEYKGNTIAVLGSGLNKIYPETNIELVKEILQKNGCIISEYEPNQEVNMKNFPLRNRIISGISIGVIVIEAKYRSGSRITAGYGFEQGKKVFCIPRNLGETNGIGTNQLIQKGAILVTNPKEILCELKLETTISSKNTDENIYEYDIEEANVPQEYKDVYKFISNVPTNINKIIISSKLPISVIEQKLTILELEGYINSLPGNNYIRV